MMGLSFRDVFVCVWWGMCSKKSIQTPGDPVQPCYNLLCTLLPTHYSCQTSIHSRASSPVPPPFSERAELWLSLIKELPPYRPLQLAWIGHHCWKKDGEGRAVRGVDGRMRTPDHSREARVRQHKEKKCNLEIRFWVQVTSCKVCRVKAHVVADIDACSGCSQSIRHVHTDRYIHRH